MSAKMPAECIPFKGLVFVLAAIFSRKVLEYHLSSGLKSEFENATVVVGRPVERNGG